MLSSVTMAALGAVLLVVLDPGPVASAALLTLAIGAVALHSARLRAHWQAIRHTGITDLIDEVEREIERSRRYDRQLSLVILHPMGSTESAELARTVRVTDRLFSLAAGGTAVLLPETDRDGCERFLARIGKPEAGCATFPHDARTAEALVSGATRPVDAGTSEPRTA